MNTENKRMLGFVSSPEDKRDYVYGQFIAGSAALRSSVLYDIDHGLIKKQTYGNCVGQASRLIKVIQEIIDNPTKKYDFSPDFIYNECKKIDGLDVEGTTPRSAMSILKNIGAALDTDYPKTTVENRKLNATPDAIQRAKEFRVASYARIYTLQELKAALQNEGPVMLATTITDNFYENSDGLIDYPKGYWLGGHAFTAIGYDDNKTERYPDGRTETGFVVVANSWGRSWGQDGIAYIPYSVLMSKSDLGMPFIEEMWTLVDIRTGKGGEVKPPVDDTKPAQPSEYKTSIEMTIGSLDAKVNGKVVKMTQAPIIISGLSLVPMRFIAEQAGYVVGYDNKAKQINLVSEDRKESIIMWVDKNKVIVNGVEKTIDVGPSIRNGVTMVPLRFVSEIAGFKVKFENASKKILLQR